MIACLFEQHRRRDTGEAVNTQRGSVLVEFSFIAVGISLLIALVVDVARMVFITQVLQETARVAARELALLPLSPAITFEEALEEPQVKSRIFDPSALVIEVQPFGNKGELEEYIDGLPIVNRMLRPLMVYDQVTIDGRSRDVLRFPGTLLRKNDYGLADTESIGIPHIGMSRPANGQNVRWKSILEEIRGDQGDPQSGAFSLLASHANQPSGLVALRVNYPFQPLFMNWMPQKVLSNSDEKKREILEQELPSHGQVQFDISVSDRSSGNQTGSDVASLATDSINEHTHILFGQSVHRREVFQ